MASKAEVNVLPVAVVAMPSVSAAVQWLEAMQPRAKNAQWPVSICICGSCESFNLSAPKGWRIIDFNPAEELIARAIYVPTKNTTLTCVDGRIHIESHSITHNEGAYLAEANRLRALLENASEGISILSPEGRALYISPAGRAILGYTTEEFEHLTLLDILHPDHHAQVAEVLEEALKNPGVRMDGGAVRMLRKDGVWRWCEANITNMLHDPDIGGILDSFRDVTELIEARQRSEFNESNTLALINSSADEMWSIDTQYRLVSANEAFGDVMRAFFDIEMRPGINVLQLPQFSDEEKNKWKALYNRVFSGESATFEHAIVHPLDGSVRWMASTLSPIVSNGKIEGAAGYSVNITPIRKRNQELETLNERLTLGQQIAQLGYWEFDNTTKELLWSDELFYMMGWEPGRDNMLPLDQFRSALHPDDSDIYGQTEEKILNGAAQYEVSHRAFTASGSVIWLKQMARIIRDEKGTVVKMLGATQEITREKQTALQLEARNAFIETVFENLPIGITANDVESGKTTIINPSFSEAYGWPAEDLASIDRFFENVYPDPAFRQKIRDRIMGDMLSGDSDRMMWNEIPITTKSGELRVVNARNIPLPEQGLMISTVVDVTDAVRSREALVLSNERFEYACRASFDAMWDYDVATETVYWGTGVKENFGHSFKNNASPIDIWGQLIHPEDRRQVIRGFDGAIENKKRRTWKAEYRFKRLDGTYAFVADRGYILRNPDGAANRMIGAMQDITESKQEELKLRLRDSVISNTKEAVLIGEVNPQNKDLDTTVFINQSFTAMTGIKASDIIGKSAEILFAGQEDEHALNHFRMVKRKLLPMEIDMPSQRTDGSRYWMSFSLSPVPDASGNFTHWVIIMRDITERRDYVQLLQKQNKRLKDIAFTQSHVVRAPLARLMGLVNVLAASEKEDPDFDALLRNVKVSANELDTIIHQIVGKTKIKNT